MAYKSNDQVPDDFRRKLFRLSAKFEEADEQFEEIRSGLLRYRESIKTHAKDALDSMREQSLNLDTLAALLDSAFPNYKNDEHETEKLLTEVKKLGFGMGELVDAIKAQRPHIKAIESMRKNKWAQVGVMRNALDISNDVYYASRRNGALFGAEWAKQVELGRNLLGKAKKG